MTAPADEGGNGRRSFQTTGFLAFLTSWGSTLATLAASTDPTVRKWAAVGMVVLPAIYLLCSMLIKRGKLKATVRRSNGSVPPISALLGAVKTPLDPGAPK